jgi:hypothetical protein
MSHLMVESRAVATTLSAPAVTVFVIGLAAAAGIHIHTGNPTVAPWLFGGGESCILGGTSRN